MAIASLVLGIVSVVLGLIFSGWGWIGGICGIVGIVLAVLAKKSHPEQKGLCTAGLVLSIIGAALSIVLWIACMACTKAVNDSLDSIANSLTK
ncbi:MAG: hypothetical protein IKD90_02580 [Clostridiales bacterium]|nr:hypothetical protein [Clostridiales bacterium]